MRSLTWPRFIELFFTLLLIPAGLRVISRTISFPFTLCGELLFFCLFPVVSCCCCCLVFISKLLLVTIFQPCCLIRFFSLSIADYLLSFVHNMALKRPGLGRCPLGRSTKPNKLNYKTDKVVSAKRAVKSCDFRISDARPMCFKLLTMLVIERF